MSDFDSAARYAARRLDPEGFLTWLFEPGFAESWKWDGWLESQAVPFPGEPERRYDTVAAFEKQAGDEQPLAVVVEFMTTPRREILPRLAEYTLRIHRELPSQRKPTVPYRVIGVVVTLKGNLGPGNWEMAPTNCDGLGLHLNFKPFNLETMQAQDVLDRVAASTLFRSALAWVPLMKGGGEPDTAARWKELAGAEPNETRRADLGGLALIFASLTDCVPVWRKELEGWNVERSPITLEWEARGEARGSLNALRNTLLRLLHLKFGSVPESIKQAVDSQTDQATLDRWLDSVIVASSIEELRSQWGISGS
jgi:hypothetical protein